LAYAATGALVIKAAGREGFDTILLTFVAATAAVVAIEFALIVIKSTGLRLSLPVVQNSIEGFSQNRNFFAFQILMAMSATLVAVRDQRTRTLFIAVFLTGLWFCGSRSGWGAVLVLILMALFLRNATIREITNAFWLAGFACFLPLIIAELVPMISSHTFGNTSVGSFIPPPLPPHSDTAERLLSIQRGWGLFINDPVFGAGLGAFRNLHIIGSSGIPLLIHSTPLWIMAEMGLVGLVVFAWPALYILFAEFRRKKRDSASQLIILCFTALAVMATPTDMFYQRTFWFLIGAGLAMRAPVEYEW
jgi:hypothetical protein